MPALEIQLIGLAVFREALGQTLFLFARQLHAQAVGYLPGDLFLEREDIGDLAVVPLAPKLRSLGYIGQFRADHQSLAPLDDSAGKHDAYIQLAPDRLRVHLFSFVTKDGAARSDAKLRNVRQAVEDALGDPVAEIFVFLVGAQVRE